MKKSITIVFCLLFAGLLTACRSESVSAAPIPARLREEPLPGKAAALLTLDEGDELIDWCAGDLNGDGTDDIALIVERNEEDATGERFGKLRELSILLGNGKGYVLSQSSRQAVRWSGEGGMNPEPHGGMTIDENSLTVHEFGTKWDDDHIFSWQGDGLSLTGFIHCNQEWNGSDLYDCLEDCFDLLTGEFTRTGRGDTDTLLFQAVLDLPGPWTLDETPGPWERSLFESLPPLLIREHSPYNPENHDVTGILRYTPQEVLDRIHEEQYPDWEQVDIPWTEESRANYSAFLGYPVPDCYYANGEKKLYYFWLNSHYSDGGFLFLTHDIWYETDEETEIFWIKDEEELP